MHPTRKRGRAGKSARICSKVSVIIPVMNESSTLPAVLNEAKKLQSDIELITIVNGSTDGSAAIAQSGGAHVVSFDEPLGHDVGRSVGAREAHGDILLFIDGDIIIPAAQLQPYIQAVEAGVDIALNKYNGPVRKHNVHPVVMAKHALNTVLGRSDLKGASMTTVPHAISRRALTEIGAESLAVPPKAHAMAVQRGLRVEAVHLVPVGLMNPLRRRGKDDPLRDVILGDHLEALHWFIQATDKRGMRTDLARNRSMVR
ncbi:glycosyltransferase [Paenibacillus xerothermodurans]|uniref:4,4'-diaponeurosporenoate glycosyltransferase n=1 Tax=Paenibacillus xerothermodurans TaxID=1977292 RepID=A0A2W1N9S9_PAEXE|nr:glycosyltransferase [Paenibacillus xerothermodurans]PZE19921.1 glycosyltransferase [Paenibacillus xerothermodurans]